MLVKSVWFPPYGSFLEPGCGTGGIIRQFEKSAERSSLSHRGRDWTGVESDPATAQKAMNAPLPDPRFRGTVSIHCMDFLTWPWGGKRFDYAIGNPPYSLAEEFLWRALGLADDVYFLLRLPFLESKKRRKLFNDIGMPDVQVLVPRPSFINGKTDMTSYAWMHWSSNHVDRRGLVNVLYRDGE